MKWSTLGRPKESKCNHGTLTGLATKTMYIVMMYIMNNSDLSEQRDMGTLRKNS